MNKPVWLLPLLLPLAGTAAAQDAGACPYLAADTGLTWEHRGSANSDFCRALRQDGSEAFGMTIAKDAPFKPKGGNRAERVNIDGREVTIVWMPYCWGFKGLSTGPSVNHLTIDALDPVAGTQETKACLVNVVKVQDHVNTLGKPRGRAT